MTIMNLFGRSPFSPLASHMEETARCVLLLKDLFSALEQKDYAKVEEIANQISSIEHNADLKKNDIRNHLPKSLFLPIDRDSLLAILTLQDSIADAAEDAAVVLTLKKMEIPLPFSADFHQFLDKTIETFEEARKIIREMHALLESSFGGSEAEKVCTMVQRVCELEHEVDWIQKKMVKNLLSLEHEMTYTTFYLWEKILESLASISNLSENLAQRVRTTLESD